jgi:hypothetical protein
MKSVILIAGTTGWYEDTYRLARKAITGVGSDALITSNIKKVQDLMKKKAVKKVLIIFGAHGISAIDTYHQLKKLKSKVKITVLDGWSWTLTKPDKMVLLPTENIMQAIQNEL